MRETVIVDLEKFREDMITKRVIRLKFNIREAASQIGISPATVSRIENGKPPDIETFAKCCCWLETNPGKYFRVLGTRQEGIKHISQLVSTIP